MPLPIIEPITSHSLFEFAEFLQKNLCASRSPEEWVKGLSQSWGGGAPNHGFVLRDDGVIVGGIGAIYAERVINNVAHTVCNITSWCVLDAYRKQSIRLAMALVAQPGYTFTDFSPTTVVAGVLRFLKFRPLDERQAVIFNLPLPMVKARVLNQVADIESTLQGMELRIFQDHAKFPWLHHALVGVEGSWCHIIYKLAKFKRFSSANVYYLSNPNCFKRHGQCFFSHLAFRGIITTHIECRLLLARPWYSKVRTGFNAKLYMSSTLVDSDIDYLYSETMALDL